MTENTSERLVWMDLEMTGLDPKTDQIIEIATIITDKTLKVVAEGPELVIKQDPTLFEKMDDWNKQHHTQSGLWEKVISSNVSLEDAEAQTLEFIKKHTPANTSPLCGNSIWQDRRFLNAYMTRIDDYLHYRVIDVSTIKELVKAWYGEDKRYGEKQNAHRALDDIKESIAELLFYKEHIFK